MELQISNLVKQYGRNVVLDVPSLSIEKGTLLGLVGNNGAGKTTLFRLILDLLEADSGCVLSKETDVRQTETWKKYTAAFIDTRFLIEFLTPEEYFDFVGHTHGLSKEDVQERLRPFHRFMHQEILGGRKYIHSFSAGNKQKIGIIAAMMVHPEVLILDEPFNFLDPSSQIEIRDLIGEMNRSKGITVLISSHNLTHTIEISTRLILLEKGIVKKDLINTPASVTELNEYFIRQATGDIVS